MHGGVAGVATLACDLADVLCHMPWRGNAVPQILARHCRAMARAVAEPNKRPRPSTRAALCFGGPSHPLPPHPLPFFRLLRFSHRCGGICNTLGVKHALGLINSSIRFSSSIALHEHVLHSIMILCALFYVN